jgi:branched-chain amino acid transport system substrate-binding protein
VEAEAKAAGRCGAGQVAFATGWLAVHVFAQVAAKLPTITRASVLVAMNKLTDFSTDAMTAPLTYTVPRTAFGGGPPAWSPASSTST